MIGAPRIALLHRSARDIFAKLLWQKRFPVSDLQHTGFARVRPTANVQG